MQDTVAEKEKCSALCCKGKTLSILALQVAWVGCGLGLGYDRQNAGLGKGVV